MAFYWGSCAAGLQFALVSEVEKLEDSCVISDSLFLGGVLFSTSSSAAEIMKLRSADNIYAFLGHFEGVPAEKDAAILYMKELIPKIDWGPSLDLFMQWKNLKMDILVEHPTLNGPAGSLYKETKQGVKSFRVSCDRACVKMKKHEFTSMDAAAALGEGVHKLFGWPADMCRYNLEILGWIRDGEILLALALIYSGIKRKDGILPGDNNSVVSFPLEKQTKEVENVHLQGSNILEKHHEKAVRPSRADSQLYSRRQYRKALVQTSLKPSTAYALLQLGRVSSGSIIVDPMCGCGTIPLEAAEWLGAQAMCLSGDISTKAVEAAHENAGANVPMGLCDVLKWDASNLPLRSGSVDCIVCDMPFGVRCGNSKVREWLCPKVVKEVIRVLRLGTGTAVLMSHSKSMRHEVEIKQKAFLQLLHHLIVEMEGIRVDVFVLQRTQEVFISPDFQMHGSSNVRSYKRTCSSRRHHGQFINPAEENL